MTDDRLSELRVLKLHQFFETLLLLVRHIAVEVLSPVGNRHSQRIEPVVVPKGIRITGDTAELVEQLELRFILLIGAH